MVGGGRGGVEKGEGGGGLDLYVWSDLAQSAASLAWKNKGARGQEAWEAGAMAMIEIQPRSGQ